MTQNITKISTYQHKYDDEHDVLHIFFPPYAPSYDDEEYPGIIIKRSVTDERITGFVIIDYKKNKVIAQKLYPQFKYIFQLAPN
jgi:hypothetical protein